MRKAVDQATAEQQDHDHAKHRDHKVDGHPGIDAGLERSRSPRANGQRNPDLRGGRTGEDNPTQQGPERRRQAQRRHGGVAQ